MEVEDKRAISRTRGEGPVDLLGVKEERDREIENQGKKKDLQQ